MSRFKRHHETDLERRLRAERPEPSERLVQMVAERSRAPERRVRLAPRLAVVGAVTAVMLAALGAVGTAGYAGTAITTCVTSIRDVVHVSSKKTSSVRKTRGTQGHTVSTAKNGNSGNGNNGNGNNRNTNNGNGNNGNVGDPADAQPWQDQYHQKFPICHNGNTLFLPLPAYIAHLLNHPGDSPGEC